MGGVTGAQEDRSRSAGTCSSMAISGIGEPKISSWHVLHQYAIFTSSESVPLGCYSTHILLSAGTAVVPLPPQLDTVLATPVNCALATMVAARKCARQGLARYSGERQERKVLIFGGGLLGLYGCSLFKEDGFQAILPLSVT